jgi:hypothetical protein
MKIESSNVKMSSETKSSYEMVSQSQVDFKSEIFSILNTKQNSKNPDELNNTKEVVPTDDIQKGQKSLETTQYITKMILEMILQSFLGGNKKVKMYDLKDIACGNKELKEEPTKLLIKNNVTVEESYEYSRSDSISFNAQATVKTKDKDINLNLDLSYTRAFYEKHSKTLKFDETHFLDPLVIQYDGKSSAFDNISDKMCFNFDINSDGKSKELPLLKDGNGFLVLDKNGNGTIDDGSELFGPSSNDGFGELSKYDSDGNNWIDENDPIFKDLRIWTKNEKGDDKLIALGQSGIGALYLNDAKAGMAYNKSVNESLAYLKSNSIFVREDGTSGIISSMEFKS